MQVLRFREQSSQTPFKTESHFLLRLLLLLLLMVLQLLVILVKLFLVDYWLYMQLHFPWCCFVVLRLCMCRAFVVTIAIHDWQIGVIIALAKGLPQAKGLIASFSPRVRILFISTYPEKNDQELN